MHSDRKKESVQRRGHANFAPNSREKNCENPESFQRATRTLKSCVNSASVVARTAELRCSPFLSRHALSRKIARDFSVEMTQILRENRAKILQNFRKSGTPRAQRIACTRPACVAHTSQRRRVSIDSILHSDPKKNASGVGITQLLRRTRAKEI